MNVQRAVNEQTKSICLSYMIFHHRGAVRCTKKARVMVSHCSLFSPLLLGGDLITCLLMHPTKCKSGAFKRQQAARLQVF